RGGTAGPPGRELDPERQPGRVRRGAVPLRAGMTEEPALPATGGARRGGASMFSKILIANRGEIALRVIRAARELGIKTVAVHSTADVHSLHVRFADESLCIGLPSSKVRYLNIPALLSEAEVFGADAINPGYGFLSETPPYHAQGTTPGLGWL